MENYKKRIQITIGGETNTGKTAITSEIVDILRSKGFNVSYELNSDFANESKALEHGRKISPLMNKENLEINVSEVQTHRFLDVTKELKIILNEEIKKTYKD
jgi:nucleoside-triphosphatase THEP1